MGVQYDNLIKQTGLKSTKQRCAVLEVLERSGRPLAAEQVYAELSGNGINVNLSTVYRTLETMADKGLIIKLGITGDSRALFEFNTNKHRHYLVCLGCKKILAIDHCPLEAYEARLASQTDYEIAGHRLDVYGYCPKCRKKGKADGGNG